jgi:hypothetical protein
MTPLSFLPSLNLHELHQGLLRAEKLDYALNIEERGNFSQDVGVCHPFTGIIKSRGINERHAAAALRETVIAPNLGCHRLNTMSNLNVFVACD